MAFGNLIMKVWLTLLLASTLHSPAFALSMNDFNLDNSLVPANQIFLGGPPRDGIPALDHPHLEAAGKPVTVLYDDRTQTARIHDANGNSHLDTSSIIKVIKPDIE